MEEYRKNLSKKVITLTPKGLSIAAAMMKHLNKEFTDFSEFEKQLLCPFFNEEEPGISLNE